MVPARQVPAPEVDLAINLVSQLKDVQEFIKDVKGRQGALGVRVDFADTSAKSRRYKVFVFEKKDGKEDLYDWFLVSNEKKRILKRGRKGNLSP